MRGTERGFSLIEVMIASGMLVTGVLGLIGMQVTAINSGRFGNRMTQAMMFADEMANSMMGTKYQTLQGYPTAADAGQPDGFAAIAPSAADPTGASLAFPPDGLAIDGSPAAYNAGTAVYQRAVQIIQEDLNPLIPGADAVRIKVSVRFRDNSKSTTWRQVSLVVLRSGML